jgi:branched-chain amino acid aminotransferase
MRVKEDRILLQDLHYRRLLNGSQVLGLEPLSFEQFKGAVLELCARNGHSLSARVRLTVFRGEVGEQDSVMNYVVQTAALEAPALDRELVLGIFPKGRKACDGLSHLKSNNYLLYSMAAMYARSHGWDDCLVLNNRERIADTSIANLFYVIGDTIYTPPLSEGGVGGVMREWLIGVLPGAGFRVIEKPVAAEDLILADEIFLSNAIRGVRRVGHFSGARYGDRFFSEVVKIVDGTAR